MPVSISYAVQRPGDGTAILNAYRDFVAGIQFDRITGLYAFASAKGVRLLSEALAGSPRWQNASKRWVISIDGGITEPESLRLLLNQRNAEVRVPYGEELLRRNLRPIFRFHPKTLLLERQDATLIPSGIMVGSANLTCSGLCFGHEHAMAVRASADSVLPMIVAQELVELEATVNWAPLIDANFIDRYAAMRPAAPAMPVEFEDDRAELLLQANPVIPASQSVALAAAKHFWIEVEYVVANRGRREEGNQIDMQRGSRVFFGFGDRTLGRNSPIGHVRIQYRDHLGVRNLRFGNNSMDKLDLPIPGAEGPPSYSNQTLLFVRESPGTFRLSLGTEVEIAAWKAKSRGAATLYTMRGGRQFGVF